MVADYQQPYALRILCIVACLGVAACDSGSSSSGDGEEGGVSGDPAVSFAELTDGDVFETVEDAIDISVLLSVSNLNDGDTIAMSIDGNQVGFASADGAFTFAAVAAGQHDLAAQVVDADGESYTTNGARDTVSVTVRSVDCLADADCDDADECTTDSCSDGTCSNEAIDGCPAVEEPECTTAADCQGEQLDVCQTWGCTDGECVVDNVADGTSCDDANACTEGDSCQAGTCAAGDEIDCDDGNACTTDACSEEAGCANIAAEGRACDDGDACTEGDSCTGGNCMPGENACECEADADCEAFEDGDPCTGTLFCVDNTCVVNAATVINCPDSSNGCVELTCSSESGACEPVAANEGGDCDDGDACTESDTCASGECAGAEVVCDDGDVCTNDACDPVSGCVTAPASGAECDDGDACTADDECSGGGCTGSAVECDDDNPCTDDTCSPATGCSSTPNSAACDDGDSCTDGDTCAEGSCQAGANTCECENDGDCAAFEDGDLCNGTLSCVENECVVDSSTVVECPNPADPCLVAVCEADTGECGSAPAALGTSCDDGDACTTADACSGGTCGGSPVTCAPDSECFAASCDPDEGCVQTPQAVPCDDGNSCTTNDICTNGVCVGAAAADCDDDNDCTIDTCDDVNGCVNLTNDGASCKDDDPCTTLEECAGGACFSTGSICDDEEPCTIGTCVTGLGCGYTNAPFNFCDDDSPCTAEECVDGEGCVYSPISGPSCLDGDVCTTGDICFQGNCAGELTVVCDDNNPCTSDFCDPTEGCVTENLEIPCDDGDACTQGDTCFGGNCLSGAAIPCDDGNPCTADECDADTGCVFVGLDDLPCEDGDPNTVGDKCNEAGECESGEAVDDELAEGSFCGISGSVGDVIECSIFLARESLATPEPVSLEFTIDYAPFLIQPLQLQDQICMGGACFDQAVPPADLYPSGHTVIATPSPVGLWFGSGSLEFTHIDTPNTPLSEAWLGEDGSVVGDAKLVEFEVLLVANVDPADDVTITASNLIAFAADGLPMTVEAKSGVLVAAAELPDCTVFPEQCDDGFACTLDFCDFDTAECVNVADDASCDDGIDCTTDVCDLESGCISSGDDAPCDDGNNCTMNACEVGVGCTTMNLPAGAPCDDGDACTDDDACDGDMCMGGTFVDCADGNPCTTPACNPSVGCFYTPLPGKPCDDGNSCTIGDACTPVGLCQSGTPVGGAGCSDGGEPICDLVGGAGDEVDCFLQVARTSQDVAPITALQLTLSFDATQGTLVAILDSIEFPGVGTVDVPVAPDATGTPAQPLSTGHSLSLSPSPVGGWNGVPCETSVDCGLGGVCGPNDYCVGTEESGGFGAILAVNFSDASIPLTEAYLAPSGEVVGESDIFWLRFALSEASTSDDPFVVLANDLLGSDEDSQEHFVEVLDGLLVTTPLAE